MEFPRANLAGHERGRLSRWLSLGGALGLLIVASCSSSTNSKLRAPQATAVLVSPNDFLGEAVCGGPPGNFLVYQATLLDVTESLNAPFVLPSGPLTSCELDTYFEKVVIGHRYVAKIQGFDVNGLKPLAPGSSLITDSEGKSVAPRFTTTCYGEDDVSYNMGGAANENFGLGGVGAPLGVEGTYGAEAFDRTRVFVRGCLPLHDASPGGSTRVLVSLASALNGYRCGTAPGEIASYTIEGVGTNSPLPSMGGAGGFGGTPSPSATGGSALGGMGGGDGGFQLTEFGCGDTYSDVVTEAAPKKYELLAYESGQAAPSFATTCFADPVIGFTISASCDPLRKL